MVDTLADTMQAYYASQLGHQGSIIELEREYFQAATNETWADAALQFYSEANGSNPVGSLNDEIFKYYSQRSGLSPAASYSTADHMIALFGSGGGHAVTPPITDQLEAFFDAGAIDGYSTDARISKNLCTANQASIETDTTGFDTQNTSATTLNFNIARSTAQQLHGNASLACTAIATGVSVIHTSLGVAGRAVTPGTTYTAVTYSKAGSAGTATRARIAWWKSNGTQATTTFNDGSDTTNTTTGWTQHTVTAVAPSDAAYASVATRFTSVTIAQVMYVDQIGLWEGSSTDWVLPGKLHPVNLLTYNQATVETDTTGWFKFFGAGGAISRTTAQAWQGSASITYTLGAGTNDIGIGLSTYSAPVIVADFIPVVAGKTYTISMYVRAASTTCAAELRYGMYNSAGNSVGSGSSTSTATTTGWVQRTITVVAPANSVCMLFYMRFTGAVGGEVHYLDGAGVWEGAQTEWVPPYRGSTVIADGEAVGFWRDISGKNRHLTQAGVDAIKPLFRKTSVNLLTANQASVETDLTGLIHRTAGSSSARTTAVAEHGTASLQITSGGAGTNGGGLPVPLVGTPTTNLSCIGGRTYTAVLSGRCAAIVRNANAAIYWYDSSFAFISASSGSSTAQTTTGWTKNVVTGVAPANAAYARPILDFLSLAGVEVDYIDSLGFWEGSDVAWKPPVTLGNSKPTTQWAQGQSAALQTLIGNASQSPTATTIYVVCMLDGIGYSHTPVLFRLAGAAYVGAASAGPFGRPATVWGSSILNSNVPTSNAVLSFKFGAATEVRSNGGAAVSGAAASGAATATWMMGSGSPTAGGSVWPGTIAAVLVYSKEHTDTERQQIERWLGARYGVTVA